MAAIMDVYFDFGGSDTLPGTNQDTDDLGPPSLRFKSADDATIDTGNPVLVPSTGTRYSYWKQIYLYCADPDGNTIDNIKFYSDGAIGFGTGVTLMAGDETPTKNSGSDAGYEVATGTSGTTGDEMVAAHAGLTGSTDAASLTSGSPLAVSISEGEIQTLTPDAIASGGTFTITYDGQTTGAINHNATKATIDAAIEALSNVTVGDVTIGGQLFSDGTDGLTIAWLWSLGTQANVTVDVSSLTNVSSVTVTESSTAETIDLATETSNYVILQVNVVSTASAGLTSSETLTFQYDETP